MGFRCCRFWNLFLGSFVIVFCILAHAYLFFPFFFLLISFSSAWLARQKRIFMSFMFCQEIFTFKNYQERASPEKKMRVRKRKREEGRKKITQIETFIHRCEKSRHEKSHASFNADRHKYHTIYLWLDFKNCVYKTRFFPFMYQTSPGSGL